VGRTDEDDRDTPGEQILKTIASGAEKFDKKEGKNLFKILDRTAAIEFAFKTARAGDTVLLLGKGNEKTIERADGEHDWDELAVARRILQRLVKKQLT
jgi:UDP-N-acetylmuramoyl-L-alanyl-D-glutamate--2,6-diaminopimelate ligase